MSVVMANYVITCITSNCMTYITGKSSTPVFLLSNIYWL